MSTEGRVKDKKILFEMLVKIEDRLHIIVIEESNLERAESKFRKEFQRLLPGPWDEVVSHFRASKEWIEKDRVNWEYLEGLGLTGDMLAWKEKMLNETLREGVVSRFFKVVNSLLGSLSKAIPPLEIVKEYKELVEASLRYLRG